ncbi:MAG TPA: tripartite tricarboxylate transporter substrate binding protein [Xanthobacteraceae bacterium]|nr:tripartite tricarboxylate transporter substrate binding protein [Xanthobacteraceae bacterium]
MNFFDSRGVVLAVFLAVTLAPGLASAQQYPTQPIRIIVPNPAGGLPDTLSRIVGKRLQERIGQPVVIENRPGANAGIGTAALTASAPDGYTFLMTDGAVLSISPLIYLKLPYNPKDMMPVSFVATAPIWLAAHEKVPVRTMAEFVAYVKANPGKSNYGSSGVGSFHHLSMEAIQSSLNVQLTHVPFKGSADSVTALLGGHIDYVFSSYASLSAGVDSNRIRLIASNGAQRAKLTPNLPTIAETIPGYNFAVNQGLFARAGTPREIVQRIAGEIAVIVKEPEVVAAFDKIGAEPASGGTEDLARAMKDEQERVAKAVAAAGIKPQ